MSHARFILVVLFLIVFSFGELTAQSKREQHVQWIVSVSKTGNGDALIVMNALIDKGWHLYSMEMEDDGPTPTAIQFHPGKYRLQGETKELGMPVTVFDSTFQMNITWYEENVLYTQKVQYNESETIAGEITFMVCSSSLCIPGEIRFKQVLP